MKNTKILAKMYDYENLIYYDNALYEHNHNHTSENYNYQIRNTKIDLRTYRNMSKFDLLIKGAFLDN